MLPHGAKQLLRKFREFCKFNMEDIKVFENRNVGTDKHVSRMQVVKNFIPLIQWILVLFFRDPNKKDKVSFYNCSNNGINLMTLNEALDIDRKFDVQYPYNKILWTNGASITNNKLWYCFCFIFLQLLPAFLLDIGLRLMAVNFRCVLRSWFRSNNI